MIGMPILKINYVRSKESYMSSNNNIYYVYVYLDPRTPGQYVSTFCSLLFKPFYVGYGKNNRLFDHLKEARPTRKYKNSHKLNTIRELTRLQLLPIIFKVATNLSKKDVDFYLENNYNITYGRLNKPSKQRIIFEGELKGKYRTNQDISDNPTQCYQIGLIWKHDKPTFKNHKQI
jgi:hypothetical protein